MTRISIVIMIVLALMAVVVVQAQVTPLPERAVGLQILPGEDGLFYVFCTGACDRFLNVADVSELHAGFERATDAHNHGLILMARLNGGVARLLPGTVFTPTP